MTLGKKLFAIALMFYSVGNTHAQCTGGVNTGGGSCTPPTAPGMPGYDGDSASPQVRPQYPSQWGAVVVDYDTGAAGTVTNRASANEAIRDAMSDCKSHGSPNCKLSVSYANGCAAVSWGPSSYAAASDAKKSTAERIASEECDRRSPGCKIVYSACSLPGRAN